MRKLVTLLAATTLLVSSIALAEEGQTTTNSNDVLQTIPHDNNTAEGVNVADASNTAPADAAKTEDAAKANEPAVAKKHHCNKHKHHCKKHHHHAKKEVKMNEPAQPNDTRPTQ